MDWFLRIVLFVALLGLLGALGYLVYQSAHDPHYWLWQLDWLIEGNELLLLILAVTVVVGTALALLVMGIDPKTEASSTGFWPFLLVFLVLLYFANR